MTFAFLIKNFQYKEYIISHLFSANVKSPVLCVGRMQSHPRWIYSTDMCDQVIWLERRAHCMLGFHVCWLSFPRVLSGRKQERLLNHIIPPRQGFSPLALLTFGSPMHWRICTSIPDLSRRDARKTSKLWQSRVSPDTANCLSLRTPSLRIRQKSKT